MEESSFTWTHELAERLLEIRFGNDWLFKKYKQPWQQFHNLLLENGFPKEMTVSQVRKKYGYMYDMYLTAKKNNNENWPYYKLFDQHYSKAKITDVKYDSWSNEWRLKLVTCVAEIKAHKVDYHDMWRTVEKALRSIDLPVDCCIQDLKGLWNHISVTFNRKHRLYSKKGIEPDWPLYTPMLEYFQTNDPDHLIRIETESPSDYRIRERKASDNYFKKGDVAGENGDEFQWTKHSTESFIQIRLQHDFLFRDRKWAWNDLRAIMVKEYGFPKYLSGRDICKKWNQMYGDYQKSQATNNKSWIWYNLFEVYLGDTNGAHSFNPLVGWQEEWILNFISARTELEFLFLDKNLRKTAWREVEKRLRTIGLPQDHSLLQLSEMWAHLLKTFYWKDKFAKKGILTEQWPYYDVLAEYDKSKLHQKIQLKSKPTIKIRKFDDFDERNQTDHFDDDDYEDDMKLLDLKHKLDLKPKVEVLEENSCRSCANDGGCVNIFEQKDDEGFSLADKINMIADIQVDPSDGLPLQICLTCLQELENAYKYRRKCQEVDKTYRNNEHKIKVEVSGELYNMQDHIDIDKNNVFDQTSDTHADSDYEPKAEKKVPLKVRKPKIMSKKKKRIKKERYDYSQMCEICGVTSKNLKNHMDAHAVGKFYSCDLCDKKFKHKGGLIVHKAIHEPTPRKTCEVCGKSFHILSQYRRHFVYHANERRFACETCGKRFNTIDILKIHNRIHTGERPFSCSECGKTFRSAGCVSRHKRIVHKSGKVRLIT